MQTQIKKTSRADRGGRRIFKYQIKSMRNKKRSKFLKKDLQNKEKKVIKEKSEKDPIV